MNTFNEIKRYTLDPKVAAETHKRELPWLLVVINGGLEHFANGHKAKIEYGSISALDGELTLVPVTFYKKRIGGVQEVAGWQIAHWKIIPATDSSPQDIADSVIGEPGLHIDMAKKFVAEVVKLRMNKYWEMLEEDHYEEMY